MTEKIELFKNIWSYLATNHKVSPDGLKIENPHLIVKELITEVEENRLRNTENRNIFRKKIENFLHSDQYILGVLKADFLLVRDAINTRKENYLLNLCKEIKIKFTSGEYIEFCLRQVGTLLTEESPCDYTFYERILYLSQVIMTELIISGYSLLDIKLILSNAFATYRFVGKSIFSEFPHQLERKKYCVNEILDEEKYSNALKNFINDLTLQQRLDSILYYFKKKTEQAIYLFKIDGLKNLDSIKLGDVTFLSSKSSANIFTRNSFSFQNTNKTEDEEEDYFAAVSVNYLLPHSSAKVAINKIESALDLIALTSNLKIPFYIYTNHWEIFNFAGESLSSHSERDTRMDKFWRRFRGLDLTTYKNSLDSDSIFTAETFGHTIAQLGSANLSNALHWYRKADEATKDSDQLLYYWIAIENVFSIEHLNCAAIKMPTSFWQ
jgi:hypothetical protein